MAIRKRQSNKEWKKTEKIKEKTSTRKGENKWKEKRKGREEDRKTYIKTNDLRG